MSVPAFGIVFLPLFLLCLGQPFRLLQLLMVAASFDAAAVVTVGNYGVAPSILPAAAFCGLILLQRLQGARYPGQQEARRVIAPLVVVTGWAIFGSLLFPVVFAGQMEVWPQKAQIILGKVPLAPGAGNLTQDAYLVLACLVVTSSAAYLSQQAIDSNAIVKAYYLSGFLVAALAFWQLANKLAGVPYPETFLRSNPGWGLLEQSLGSVPRISGPFSEPAALANYMLGILGAAGWMLLKGHAGIWLKVLFALAFVTVLISTSTTGFVVLVFMAIYVPVYALRRRSQRLLSRAATIGALLVALGGIGVFGLLTFKPSVERGFAEVYDSTINKGHSVSYDLRSDADLNSLSLFVSTYGLGVGWGSNRSSSLLPGTLASLGIVGTLGVLWFAANVAKQARRARPLVRRRSDAAVMDAATGATVASLAAALLSGPTFIAVHSYLLLGLLIGTSTRVLRERRVLLAAQSGRSIQLPPHAAGVQVGVSD